MVVKTKAIDVDKIRDVFRKTYSAGFVEKEPVEYVRTKRKLTVEVLIKASTSPKVVINPYTDSSFWDFQRNYINIGILEWWHEKCHIDMEELAKSLFTHEISHENHTSVPKDLPYPFSLLNILEDERIERLAQEKWGSDFASLHEVSFEIYYTPFDPEKVFNPFNLIILHRWSRWSVKVKKKFAGYLKKMLDEDFITLPIDPTILPEYPADIEKVLDDATRSKTTEQLIENTLWFYEKWKHLFNKDREAGIAMGIGHGSGEGAGDLERGQGQNCDGECKKAKKLSKEAQEFIEEELEKLSEDEEVEREWDIYDEYVETERKEDYFADDPIWTNDRGVVEFLKRELKKIRWISKQTQIERAMLGRKPDARRVENLLPNPMRRRKEKVDNHIPRVLFVIDGSGSMNGYPYHNAIHIAVAFMETLKERVSVVITLDNGKYYPVRKVSDLLRYECDGGQECLNSTQNLLPNFDLTIFFTDACVRSSDEQFLKRIKSNRVIGMLTTLDVEEAREWLPKHFKKVVIARDLKGLVKQLAFLLRRM